MQVGLKAVEALTNRSGGINGTPVHFEIVDDGSNPGNAIQLANQIIAKNAAAILGPSLTSDCQSVFPRIIDSGPVTYCFSPALYPNSNSLALRSDRRRASSTLRRCATSALAVASASHCSRPPTLQDRTASVREPMP